MNTDEKKMLARTGDMGRDACATRLKAAILSIGIPQADIATSIGRRPSSVTNQINGDQFPSRELMAHLYEEHRIDFNFIMAGAYAQLPADVEEKLFQSLAASRRRGDSKANSD